MNKTIVISADALVHEDIAYLRTLPNFRRYLEGGCEIQRVKSVYPSVTYPCHVTMSSGVYPDRHGIVSNFQLTPQESVLPWEWFFQAVKVPDLFTAAKKAGLSTGAVFWPVTGGHPDIDYLIAEYWAQGAGDTPLAAFARAGSSEQMLKIARDNLHMLVERTHPMVDEFIIACTVGLWRRFAPDLLMIHPANVDGYRHQYGLYNERVTVGIEETDRYLGYIMRAVEQTTPAVQVNLVLTSDHGQMDLCRVINLNVLFAQRGLLTPKEEGGCASWDAFCLANGFSAMIYLSRPEDPELRERVFALLCEARDLGECGIGEVMTRQECARRERLDGGFSFVVESDGVTSFGGDCSGPLVSEAHNADYRYGVASHGYLPHKGPQPVFIAKGPAFEPGATVERANLVDIAPTLAAALGVELPGVDGRVVAQVLRR